MRNYYRLRRMKALLDEEVMKKINQACQYKYIHKLPESTRFRYQVDKYFEVIELRIYVRSLTGIYEIRKSISYQAVKYLRKNKAQERIKWVLESMYSELNNYI